MRMNKYGRELDLLLLLTDNGTYTAQQIADRLGITRRMLYYYFDYLRSSGFHLIKSGLHYRLDRNSIFFKKLQASIALTEDEAAYICRTLDASAPDDIMAQGIKTKLSRQFCLADTSNPALLRRVNKCIEALKEAMVRRQMVVLKNYSSPHSHTVSDRIVEPFLLMNNGREVRCHEIKSHQNKTFKLSRMEKVEIIDVPWIHEDEHRQVYTDFFMFSGEHRYPVELTMGQLSHNLMIEEYPLSEPCFSPIDATHWRFSGHAASLLGIGRFILGLYDDIEILGCDELKTYIADKVEAMRHG
jgi:predicted DNA-binding transcriptional regulator YafY